MKYILRPILLVFISSFVFHAPLEAKIKKHVQARPVAPHIDVDANSVVDRLAKSYRIKLENLSMYISVGQGESLVPVLDVNARQSLIPASISKIATTAAFLKHYPPGTKFRTQVFLSESPRLEEFKGDLYLKGGGDPGFVSESMWYLVNVFSRTGVRKINGNIIVDDSLFDEARYDESRESVRVDRAYDAPVGAMSFNWNSVNVFVRPTNDSRSQVILDPENDYVKLVNKINITNGSENHLVVSRVSDEKNKQDVIQVTGSIGRNLGTPMNEMVVFKNITRPSLWAGANLKSFLAQRGIQVTGEVKPGIVPAKAVLVAESESKPSESLVTDMNKFSNNFVAEMLCKHLGVLKGQPGDISKGVSIIRDYLNSLGLTEKDITIVNPSGLTRDNRASAWAIWKILQTMREDFTVQAESMMSLPISGVDGTLRKRMKGTPAERMVRGKTGYLDNVVSLAGYAGVANKQMISFAFIYNGSTDESKVREFFDKVLTEIVSN